MAKFDVSVKDIPATVGHSIFEACDTLAQNRLLEAEASNVLALDRQSGDPAKSHLIQKHHFYY